MNGTRRSRNKNFSSFPGFSVYHRASGRGRKKMRFLVACMAVIFLLLSLPAVAEMVVFQDGRTLKVVSFRFLEDRLSVELEGGGHMEFSTDYVDTIAPDEFPVPRREPPDGVAAGEADEEPEPADFAIPWIDEEYKELVFEVSENHGLEPAFLAAVIKVESNFDPGAVSVKGAKGLMQLMEATAGTVACR